MFMSTRIAASGCTSSESPRNRDGARHPGSREIEKGGFPLCRVQHLAEITGNHRLAEIIALGLGEVLLLKEGKLFSRFHTLRHDPLMQTFAHADHGADDAGVVRVRGEIAHEGMI